MSQKHLGLILGATLMSVVSTAFAGISLMDGFESQNLSAPNGPSPAANTNGFTWGSPNYTSIVGMVNGTPTRVWDGTKTSDTWPGHDFTCKDQTYCLRFRYPAGQNMSEQRFDTGTAYRDVWFKYWLRVPVNYVHGTANPSNHKFFAVWMDDYSAKGNGPTVIWEFWGDGSGGSDIAVHYSTGGYTAAGPHLQLTHFISTSDQGRWMEVVLHVKAATNTSSNDGVIQMWRRWSNESAYTKFHELTNADIGAPSNGPNGWKAGYLMGWTNAPYANDTEWLLDGFTISPDILVGPITTSTNPPAAPQLIVK